MSDQYILRIGSDGKPRSLLSFNAQSSYQKQIVTQWSDALLKGKSLTILLPGNWLYLTQTQVPSKNADVLEKSIPFAIEEELSNEVEDNYFAFQQTADGNQDVVAIEKSQLDGIGEAIRNHHLEVNAIYSEFAWLPKVENVIVLWFEEKYALIRFGLDEVMRVSHQQINQLIPIFKGQLNQIVTNQADLVDHADLLIDNSLNEIKCKDYLFNHPAIDLYIDKIKQQSFNQKVDSWRKVYVLLAALLISWLGIQLFQMLQLNSEIEMLKQQQQDVLLRSFPDAAPAELVDPFAAIRSRMQLNSNQSNQRQSIVLDVMQSIGLVKQSIKLIQVNGLRLVNEQLEVQVSAPNISTINNFQQQLQLTAPNYRVQIGVNELGDDGIYKSIITVVPR